MLRMRNICRGLALLSLVWLAVGCSRLADHPLVGMAKEEVGLNDRAGELLGQPIDWQGAITGRATRSMELPRCKFLSAGPRLAAWLSSKERSFKTSGA